ncbi:MAG: aconitase family protein, partial [Alphaproteobacteria bacterium]|nr:aconitase family protein [Alphaproteobacteria bacterium]
LDHLSVPDRAIIARMIYKTGALCCYFPIDSTTLTHLALIGQDEQHIALVEAYAKAQGLWRENWPHDVQHEPTFTVAAELALDSIRSCLGGPNSVNRPVSLAEASGAFEKKFPSATSFLDPLAPIKHGDIALAVVSPREVATHPHELVLAGLVARRAAHLGLKVKPWVRALFDDMSPVSALFLEKSGLKRDLEAIGFIITLNGETTAQKLPHINEDLEKKILQNKLTVCSITSAPQLGIPEIDTVEYAKFIATPPLVIAYALAGSILLDINTKPLGNNKDGKSILLKELWPTMAEINAVYEASPFAALYATLKETLYSGSTAWEQTPEPSEPTFAWNDQSCVVRKPPILDGYNAKKTQRAQNIKNARVLALFGDNIEASAIAPYGPIAPNSPAGYYLMARNVPPETFLTYETKTGNYEVMVRGAFSHPSLKNALLPNDSSSTGETIHATTKSQMTIFDATERYQREGTPYTIIAGKDFGRGLGQDWAAKVIRFLNIRVVIAESFDPMFRINLIRLGVLPLRIKQGVSISDLKLTGEETLSFAGIQEMGRPPCEAMMTIEHKDTVERYMVHCDIRTTEGLEMLNNGSIWAATLRSLL